MASARDNSFPPDYDEYYRYRDEKLSEFGLKAFGQIESLCDKYRNPFPEWPSFYDPKQGFLDKLAKIEEMDRRRSQVNETLMSTIPPL